MTHFKKHPDGYMSFLGRDDKGLYSVRVKTPLNVFRFQTSYPKVWNELTQEIDFQRRKQLAIKLRETNIPTYDRKNYKRSRGFTGSR